MIEGFVDENRGERGRQRRFALILLFSFGACIHGWHDCGTFWIYMFLLGLLTQGKCIYAQRLRTVYTYTWEVSCALF
jgi:hypothetical protein